MKRVFSFIHSKVARRIFVLFLICALLPLCMLAAVLLQRISTKLEADSNVRLRLATKNAGMTILEGLSLFQSELESMPIPSGSGIGKIANQKPRSVANMRFRSVTIVEYNAKNSIITGMPLRLPPDALTHLDAGNALLITDSSLEAGDRIYIATTINQNLSGQDILLGEVNPEYLWNLVGYTLSPGVDISILGPSGKQLFSTRPLSSDLISIVMSKQDSQATGNFKWHREDVDCLVNYWSVFMKPAFLADSWTVIATQSRQDSLGPTRSFISTSLLVLFLTLFVVIFISSVLIRRSLVPLSVLKEGAHRLSKGDFDSRVEIASGDEFEDLATTFNEMSVQLGDQFTRLSDMGKLLQKILEARDQDTIIDEVIFHYCNTASYEWIGISILETKKVLKIQTTYSNGFDGKPAKSVRFEAPLNTDELKSLWGATEGLHIMAKQEFSKLLAPMTVEGACEFFLQPILIKNNFVGLLILGYRHIPKQFREEQVLLRQVADEVAIAMDNIRLIEELSGLNRGTIQVLANAVDAKSPWTAGHSQRVTSLALEIGRHMGLSVSDLETLQLSGLFHDIGKIGIPEVILDKPSSLTEEEYDIIKDHPRKGAEMLRPIRAYHEAIPIVIQHHEQFNGQGYPLGLAGEEIAIGARILAVADVFDALYSSRPYRPGWEIEKVLSYMEEKAGSNFDPEVVRAFLKIDLSAYIELSAETDHSDSIVDILVIQAGGI